jgi:hypothetical protein
MAYEFSIESSTERVQYIDKIDRIKYRIDAYFIIGSTDNLEKEVKQLKQCIGCSLDGFLAAGDQFDNDD